jgi:hypothetical protein
VPGAKASGCPGPCETCSLQLGNCEADAPGSGGSGGSGGGTGGSGGSGGGGTCCAPSVSKWLNGQGALVLGSSPACANEQTAVLNCVCGAACAPFCSGWDGCGPQLTPTAAAPAQCQTCVQSSCSGPMAACNAK